LLTVQDLAKIGEASKALSESGAKKLQLQNQIHQLENQLAESMAALGERDMKIEALEQRLRAAEQDIDAARKGKKWFKSKS